MKLQEKNIKKKLSEKIKTTASTLTIKKFVTIAIWIFQTDFSDTISINIISIFGLLIRMKHFLLV